jgi:antibiotic biosynthesis monooxygenase (ABM) superfamily enzyme
MLREGRRSRDLLVVDPLSQRRNVSKQRLACWENKNPSIKSPPFYWASMLVCTFIYATSFLIFNRLFSLMIKEYSSIVLFEENLELIK